MLALSKMAMKRLPAESRDYANMATMLHAGERARDLVRQILAFSRKEAPTREDVPCRGRNVRSLGHQRRSLRPYTHRAAPVTPARSPRAAAERSTTEVLAHPRSARFRE